MGCYFHVDIRKGQEIKVELNKGGLWVKRERREEETQWWRRY